MHVKDTTPLKNMVRNQIRSVNVKDAKVLAALERVDRAQFVPAAYEDVAYAEYAIPLDSGQHMFTPREVGLILQALTLRPADKILQIGTGSGYLTALLAKLGGFVYCADTDQARLDDLKEHLSKQGFDNISYVLGDGSRVWETEWPFEQVVFTSAIQAVPEILYTKVREEGHIFAIMGEAPAMHATLLTRVTETEWSREVLFETVK